MSIDWTKPIETRDGRKAEYIMRISNDGFPRVVKVTHEDNTESVYSYTEAGSYFAEPLMDNMDIVNVPEITEVFANIYEAGWSAEWRPSIHQASKSALKNSKGTVKITIEDGKAVRAEIV